MGLNCVSAAARSAGHEVKLVDLMTEGDQESSLREAIASFAPEVIGISVRNIDDQNMENPRFLLDQVGQVIACCRDCSAAPIVLGGAGYSIFPQSALEYLEADMGIQGEGEGSFPLLLERMAKGGDLSGIPGLYLRGSGLQGARVFEKDLDRFPLPEVSLLSFCTPEQKGSWIPLQTRRGCPMGCSYCSTALIEGRSIRMRRPESIVEEMACFVAAGFERFYMVDNIFNIPQGYAKALCRKISERRLPISWRCILHPGKVDTELIHLMAKAGCMEVSLGFESGCERILRGMHKGFAPDDVRRASATLQESGIRRMGFLLLGGPGETKESVLESLAFAESLNLDLLKITVGIRVYPDTDLAQRAVADGLLQPEDDLLFPRFYSVPGLGDWLHETVRRWMADRPHWMF